MCNGMYQHGWNIPIMVQWSWLALKELAVCFTTLCILLVTKYFMRKYVTFTMH